VGSEGTLVVPTQSGHLTEPRYWQAPPVPEAWWPALRNEAPGFDPALTPTRMMGAIADCLRAHPEARRSNHPHSSFAAWGPKRDEILAEHPLDCAFGERSPLARLYDLDAKILQIGVSHPNNTSLHLAEARAEFGNGTVMQGAPLLIDGTTRWVEFEAPQNTDADFGVLGGALEKETNLVRVGPVGEAECRLMRQRPVVDWAIAWFEQNREASLPLG
jgi:aminoglycoside 3-N-acetyltransferase